jgi:hypothetical protein
MKSLSALIASAALLVGTAAIAQPAPQGATGEIAERILAAHNKERAAVGAPPLQWDATLADHAASYGPVLASLRHLVHSPREGRPNERENLAMAWHGTMSPEDLVGMWSRERQLLEAGSYLFPGTSRTGNWQDIAHYTQMVWPTTTHVGCAVYSADWDYLICRYSPPGNKDGKPMFVTASLSYGR